MSLNILVYVPCDSEELYNSLSWGGFSSIFGLCSGMVAVVADPEEGGIVAGGGTYEGGMLCTVNATANEGYTFESWSINGTVVSTNVEYTFTVGSQMTLVAHFVSDDNIAFVDANVKSICINQWDFNSDGDLSYEEAASVTNLSNYFQGNLQITSFNELQYFYGLSSIDHYAFSNCYRLNSIMLPNTITAIGNSAFSGCYNLTGNLTIPNSVTSIGDFAFYECRGINGCLTIPDSVTTIGDLAFYGCSGLTENLTIPNTVTKIGHQAFCQCIGFTGNLIIPISVTTIGYGAFYGCSNFTEVMLFGTTPPSLEPQAFDPIFQGKNSEFDVIEYPIYVPYESLSVYKTADNWNDYEDRIFPWLQKSIAAHGESNGWNFIASPLKANTIPTAIDNMIAGLANNYDLYRFNQSAELEWENYKQEGEHYHFNLENGQGYLYANAEDVNLFFKGTFNENATEEVGLAYDNGKALAGWNLVGNPFPLQAYANMNYYRMNDDGSAIEPNTISSATAIPACTGIMVKATATGQSVTFSKTAPETSANQGALQIAVAQANTRVNVIQDKAIVSFNAGDQLEKFVFNKDNAQISISQSGKDFAIVYADKQGEIPLNFKAESNGEYAISVHVEDTEMEYLHLIDNLTGADINLLSAQNVIADEDPQSPAPSYTFYAKTTGYASRFRLVFSSVNGDADGDNEAFAFVSNGKIIITNAEAGAMLQVLDVTGRIIRSTDAMNCVSTANMSAGVYVLRLISGDNVKTQKIVID